MKNIIHITSKVKIRKHGDSFQIEKENAVNEIISTSDIILIVLDEIGTSISSSTLLLASEKGIPVIIINEKHEPEVFCYSLYSYYALTKNIEKQIKWKDSIVNVNIVKEIIRRKIKHQKELLKIFVKSEYVTNIKLYETKLKKATKLEEIISIEAQVAKLYFLSLFGNDFSRREKDELNYGLNYGYAILRSLIKTRIINKGLHPSLGIFHSNQFNNYNLADDVIEVYRPMVDYIVKKLVDVDGELTKLEKQKLLLVITQKVRINNNLVNLEYSVDSMIDSIINSFDKNKVSLTLPTLNISDYEY